MFDCIPLQSSGLNQHLHRNRMYPAVIAAVMFDPLFGGGKLNAWQQLVVTKSAS